MPTGSIGLGSSPSGNSDLGDGKLGFGRRCISHRRLAVREPSGGEVARECDENLEGRR